MNLFITLNYLLTNLLFKIFCNEKNHPSHQSTQCFNFLWYEDKIGMFFLNYKGFSNRTDIISYHFKKYLYLLNYSRISFLWFLQNHHKFYKGFHQANISCPCTVSTNMVITFTDAAVCVFKVKQKNTPCFWDRYALTSSLDCCSVSSNEGL